MKKQKTMTCIISAKLKQEANNRVVINGFYLMNTWKNWLGRDKYNILGQYETAPEAVAALNKILGNK